MKKYLFVVCLVFFVAGFAAAQVGPNATLYVAVKTMDLKSSAGKKVATLSYGDKVTVTKVDGKNVEVKSDADSSIIGWAPSVNFSTKKIIVGSASTTSAKEVALAGKGFNQDIENSYSSQGEVSFADVDKVEAITMDETALMRFIEEGRLSSGR
ncbi:hypothetical protein R84B8_01637 [Treponema sp. R8-4-B8]